MSERRWSLRQAAAVLLLLVVGVVVALGLQRTTIDTSAAAFLPAGDEAFETWTRAQGSFGGDPLVVLLESDEDGALVDQHLPAVLNLEGRLAALDDVAVVYGPATTLNQLVIRTQQLLAEITGRRDGLREQARREARASGASDAEAEAAADASSAEFDRRYGDLLIGGMSAGLPTLHNPAFARSVVYDDQGRVRRDFAWLLPDVTHATILVRPDQVLDQAGLDDLVQRVERMVGTTAENVDGFSATVTGAPVVTAALGDQVRAELPWLSALAFGLVAVAFAVSHRVRGIRRLLPVVVSVVAIAATLAIFGWFGIALSVGVLGFLPILLGVGSDFPIYAAHHGGTRPVLVAALASAAGFAALSLSPLPFVRTLGLALAIGVIISAVLGLSVARWLGEAGEGLEPEPGAAPLSSPRRPTATAAAMVGVCLAVAGWAALPTLPIEARPDQLAAGLPAVEQAKATEQVIGASGEVSVLVSGDDVLSPAGYEWFRAADAAVATTLADRLRPVVSPARLLRFLGEAPTAAQIDSGLRVLPDYLTSAVARHDRREGVLLYGLELTDLREQAVLLSDLREVLPPPPDGLSLEVTGLPVVAARSVALLDQGRVSTNVAGLLGAGVVLALGLRRRRWALAAFVASAAAFGWLLAGMWVLNLSLTPLTVALGSLTAAVGGEFTIVALERRARGTRDQWGPVEAAALTSAAGFAALAASDLLVLRNFALVLIASVMLAWAASRLVVAVVIPNPADASICPQFTRQQPVGRVRA